MPKTSAEKLLRYMTELKYAGADKTDAENYIKYLSKLTKLTEHLDRLYKKGEDGKLPLLDAKEVQSLRKSYKSVIQSGDAFVENTAANRAHGKAIRHVVGMINEILYKESRALGEILTQDSKVTMEDLNHKSHSYFVDLGNQKLEAESGMQSRRIPVTFNKDGNELKGYFTEDGPYNLDQEKTEMLERCASVNGTLNQEYLYIMKKAMQNPYVFNHCMKGEESDTYKQCLQILNQGKEQGREALHGLFKLVVDEVDPSKAHLNDDPDFTIAMMEFIKGFGLVYNKYLNTGRNGAGIEMGRPLEIRNTAMSALADLLNVPDLVARSVKMDVKVGNTTKSGVFMEQAKGYDIRKVTEDSPLYQLSTKNVISKDNTISQQISTQAMKNLADLQVLDYISGNTDRNLSNLFYQVEEENGRFVLSGVQGIDNTTSFGKLRSVDIEDPDRKIHGLDDFSLMSMKTADYVLKLNPEILKTTLYANGLDKEEIDACIERTQKLQNRILFSINNRRADGAIVFLKDKDWKLVKPEHLKEDPSMIGDLVRKIPQGVDYQLNKIKENQKLYEGLAQVDKRLVKSENTRYATGNFIGSIPRNPRAEIKSLKKDLKLAKTGFFVGTKKFDKVEKAFLDALKIEKKPEAERTPSDLKKLAENYQKLMERAEFYLKEKEKEEVGKLKEGKAPSEHAKIRTEFAERVLYFAQKQMKKNEEDIRTLNKVHQSAQNVLRDEMTLTRDMIKYVSLAPDSDLKTQTMANMRKEIAGLEAIQRNYQEKKNKLSAKGLNDFMKKVDQVKPKEAVKKENAKAVKVPGK